MPLRKKGIYALYIVMVMLFCFLGLWFLRGAVREAPKLQIDVQSYGAIGDGQHNDAGAFNQALAVLESQGGGVLLIPRGTYVLQVGEPIIVRNNITLQGKGQPTLRFSDMGRKQPFGYEGLAIAGSHIALDQLVIDGNEQISRGISIRAGSSDVKLHDLTIENIAQAANERDPLHRALVTGIFIYNDTEDITIANSTIRHIHANYADPVARGIFVYAQEGQPVAKRIRIANNTIYQVTPKEDGDGIHWDYVPEDGGRSDSVIENNLIYDVAKRGIKIAAPGVTIRNNHIMNRYGAEHPNAYLFPDSNPLPHDMFSGISIYSSDVIVDHNWIDGQGSYYAAIEVYMEPTQAIRITNNIIRHDGGQRVPHTNGIRLGNMRSFLIQGNKIENVHTGMYVPLMTHQSGVIASNTLGNVDFGIRFIAEEGAPASNVTVRNNEIDSRQEVYILDDEKPIDHSADVLHSAALFR